MSCSTSSRQEQVAVDGEPVAGQRPYAFVGQGCPAAVEPTGDVGSNQLDLAGDRGRAEVAGGSTATIRPAGGASGRLAAPAPDLTSNTTSSGGNASAARRCRRSTARGLRPLTEEAGGGAGGVLRSLTVSDPTRVPRTAHPADSAPFLIPDSASGRLGCRLCRLLPAKAT